MIWGHMLMEIKDIRNQTGLTQKEFAERFGIPVKTLQHWEAGESKPAPYLLHLIAMSFPQNKENMRKIETDYSVFYYDSNERAVYDEAGTKILLRIDITHVRENNLGLYLKSLFEDYYKAQEQFETECGFDEKDDIIWENL